MPARRGSGETTKKGVNPPTSLTRGHRHVSWAELRRGRCSSQPGKTTATSTNGPLLIDLGADRSNTPGILVTRIRPKEHARNRFLPHPLEPTCSQTLLTAPPRHGDCIK